VRVRLKGINTIRKRLADGGFKSYYYAWKGGPPLHGKPGTPEFIASYNAAVARKIEVPQGTLQVLLNEFQESADFQFAISARTRRDYIKHIAHIERSFNDFPINSLADPRARGVFLEWRDELAKASLRQADYAYHTLARILSWAKGRGKITVNPCEHGGKLYHGTRVDKIWTDADVSRFLATASSDMHLAMALSINTGQRQGDLLALAWSAYDGKVIKVRQKKTGAYVPVPVSDELRRLLDVTPRRSPLMLTNSLNKPWKTAGFQRAWDTAKRRAGIRGLTFGDLRGTAVVTLARAGCTEMEIYAITGHVPAAVRRILTAHYLPRDGEVAANAIAKLDAYKRRAEDQNEDDIRPTARPTDLRAARGKPEKA
jgi:integrase